MVRKSLLAAIALVGLIALAPEANATDRFRNFSFRRPVVVNNFGGFAVPTTTFVRPTFVPVQPTFVPSGFVPAASFGYPGAFGFGGGVQTFGGFSPYGFGGVQTFGVSPFATGFGCH